MESPFESSPDFAGDFSGLVRLFPLPNVALFPHVLLPLHIFEPRYIAMVESALEGDGLIAMAQPNPGSQSADDESPELFPVICVGRIVHHVRLEDGRYNLVLQGTRRARILEELPLDEPYRQAQVELLEEFEGELSGQIEAGLRTELLNRFRQLFPRLKLEHDLNHVFESDIPLSILCDVFAYSLQLDTIASQELLAEADVERRCRLLLSRMDQHKQDRKDSQDKTEKPDALPPREFPPQFSLN